MSGLQWSGQRWLVYRGTPELPGKLYWPCTDETKAKQMVSDLVKLGITAFYVEPEQNHAQKSQELSMQPRYPVGSILLTMREFQPLPKFTQVSVVATGRYSRSVWTYYVRPIDPEFGGIMVWLFEEDLATPIEAAF